MTKTAVIYSNGSQECERMSALLKALGGEFHEYFVGKHFNDKAFHDEFGTKQHTHRLPMVIDILVV